MAKLTYSDGGLRLTKESEGLELHAYADSGGVWTIGYGHTGPGVFAGLTITQALADTFLASDLADAVAAVDRLVSSPVNQNQFDALVDFAFNLGAASLAQSTLLRYVNASDFTRAALQFPLWDHCRGRVVPGLLIRRNAEAALFCTPI